MRDLIRMRQAGLGQLRRSADVVKMRFTVRAEFDAVDTAVVSTISVLLRKWR